MVTEREQVQNGPDQASAPSHLPAHLRNWAQGRSDEERYLAELLAEQAEVLAGANVPLVRRFTAETAERLRKLQRKRLRSIDGGREIAARRDEETTSKYFVKSTSSNPTTRQIEA